VSVHSALRDFFSLLLQKQQPTDVTIHELLEKNWVNQGFTSKAHEQQTYEQAKTMLTSFAQQTYRIRQKRWQLSFLSISGWIVSKLAAKLTGLILGRRKNRNY